MRLPERAGIVTPPKEADKRDINVQHITFTGPQVAAVIASLVIGLFAYLGGLGAMWTQLNAKIDDVRIESAQNYLSLSKGLLEIDKKIGIGILPVADRRLTSIEADLADLRQRVAKVEGQIDRSHDRQQSP